MNLTIKETTVLTALYQIKNSSDYLFGKDIALTKQYRKVARKANRRNPSYINSCATTLSHLIQKELVSFITEPLLYGNIIRKYRINQIGIKEMERENENE